VLIPKSIVDPSPNVTSRPCVRAICAVLVERGAAQGHSVNHGREKTPLIVLIVSSGS
jgi:hypothetical protein